MHTVAARLLFLPLLLATFSGCCSNEHSARNAPWSHPAVAAGVKRTVDWSVETAGGGRVEGEVSCLRFAPNGQPRAILVALHGLQSHKEWWAPLARELSQAGVELWAYDRPGSGVASNPTAPANAGSAAEWPAQMLAVARAAQRPGVPLYLAAVSWGARPALLAAAEPGEVKVAGVFLLNPALKTRKDFCFFAATLFRPDDAACIIPLSDDDYTGKKSPTRATWLSDSRLKDGATARFLRATIGLREPVRKALRTKLPPVWRLYGRDDSLVDMAAVEKQLAHLSGGGQQELAGGTHAMLVEQEKEVARQLLPWLGTPGGSAND